MSNVLARMFLLCLSVFITVIVMIKGWGLEPVSWWWILGGGLGLHAVILLFHVLLDRQEK